MNDLILRHQYKDRDGYDLYNIVDPDIADQNGDPIVHGSIRMQYGKNDGYRASGVRVEWAYWISEPTESQ